MEADPDFQELTKYPMNVHVSILYSFLLEFKFV